jgi:hypothetical protein
MPRWKYGPKLPIPADVRDIIKRAKWAARMAGFSKNAIRGMRWEMRKRIYHGSEEQYGTCGWLPKNRVMIRLSESAPMVGTVVHELAHAILWPIEGVRRPDGLLMDPHSRTHEGLIADILHFDRKRDLGPYQDVAR